MENELVDLVMEDTRERMLRAIEHVKSEFGAVRTGRANSTLVEGLAHRLLRDRDAAQAARQLLGARAATPRRLALRQGIDRRDRKGDLQRRPRPHALQ